MKYQEKKYLVKTFSRIRDMLESKHATKNSKTVTIHYYAQKEGNDVTKLVEFIDRYEIHILKESHGNFSLTEKIPMASNKAGFRWLKDKGYNTVNVVKMQNTDYGYKGGIIGLYIINDVLHSVILNFPEGQHDAVANEFGLDTAEVITVPYNKYLEQLGRSRSMKLL